MCARKRPIRLAAAIMEAVVFRSRKPHALDIWPAAVLLFAAGCATSEDLPVLTRVGDGAVPVGDGSLGAGGSLGSGGFPLGGAPATGGFGPAGAGGTTSTGGSGGSMSTGGGGAAGGMNCTSSCPSCSSSFGSTCCKSDGTCGCKGLFGLLPCM